VVLSISSGLLINKILSVMNETSLLLLIMLFRRSEFLSSAQRVHLKRLKSERNNLT